MLLLVCCDVAWFRLNHFSGSPPHTTYVLPHHGLHCVTHTAFVHSCPAITLLPPFCSSHCHRLLPAYPPPPRTTRLPHRFGFCRYSVTPSRALLVVTFPTVPTALPLRTTRYPQFYCCSCLPTTSAAWRRRTYTHRARCARTRTRFTPRTRLRTLPLHVCVYAFVRWWWVGVRSVFRWSFVDSFRWSR